MLSVQIETPLKIDLLSRGTDGNLNKQVGNLGPLIDYYNEEMDRFQMSMVIFVVTCKEGENKTIIKIITTNTKQWCRRALGCPVLRLWNRVSFSPPRIID